MIENNESMFRVKLKTSDLFIEIINKFYRKKLFYKKPLVKLCMIVNPKNSVKFILYNNDLTVLKYYEIDFYRLFESYEGAETEFALNFDLSNISFKNISYVLTPEKQFIEIIEFYHNNDNYVTCFKVIHKIELFGRNIIKTHIVKTISVEKIPIKLLDRVTRLLNTNDYNFFVYFPPGILKWLKSIIRTDASESIGFQVTEDELIFIGKTFRAPMNIDCHVRNKGVFALENSNFLIEKKWLMLIDDDDYYEFYFNRKGLIINSRIKGFKIFIGKNTSLKKLTDTGSDDDDELLFDDDEE